MMDLPKHYHPLSAWDEYPIHQVVAPIRHVATTDPRAFERYWFTACAQDGSLFMVTGMGFYPNLGIVDAYALLVHEGRQVTVRAHRRLAADRADLQVGPIRFDPAQPFVAWKLALGDNNQGFTFDLSWHDTKRPRFSRLDLSRVQGVPPNVHLLHDWGGYETFGQVEGVIRIGGKTIELTRDRFVGSRDHHWGVRDGVGGLNLNPPKASFTHTAQFVEFKDWGIWGEQILYDVASTAPGPLYSETLDRQFRFDPVTKHLKEAVMTNRLDNGEIRTLHFKLIEHQTAYLRCAGYAGPDGRGTPDGNYLHGVGSGDAVTGHTYDITDEATRLRLAGFEDQLCTVTCNGDTALGILECQNPVLYRMCELGMPGHSFLEGGAHA
jgi:hypothetical protein